jgi:hypothetical protein
MGDYLLYCYAMTDDHHIWRVWANFLHRWGLESFVAATLEALGPLAVIGAQAVYLGQPMARAIFPDSHIEAAARLLEDTDRAADFVAYLKGGMV